jgi:hypothetical protein
MSYIDTIDHELLGTLNGLPIYHPLESTLQQKWGAIDFACDPSNLVLGGGGGEHPALVMHDLDTIMCRYVLYAVDQSREFFPDSPPLVDSAYSEIWEVANRQGERLEFCGWSMLNMHDFVHNARSKLHAKPLGKNEAVEDWIEKSIGQFLFFSLPELTPVRRSIADLPGFDKFTVGYFMGNVTCPPPGHVREKSNSSTSNGGAFRWRYVLD